MYSLNIVHVCVFPFDRVIERTKYINIDETN